jgi:hypothetical protein
VGDDPRGDRPVLPFEHGAVDGVGVVAGGVGEHRPAAEIPEHPDVLGVGMQPIVDRDEPLSIGVDVEMLDAEVIAVGSAAGSDEQMGGGELVAGGALADDPDLAVRRGDGDAGRGGAHVDAFVGERRPHHRRDTAVLTWQQPVAPLHHGHAGAEAGEHLRELAADVAARRPRRGGRAAAAGPGSCLM